jgi:sirohydrochlorin ferrochelatase
MQAWRQRPAEVPARTPEPVPTRAECDSGPASRAGDSKSWIGYRTDQEQAAPAAIGASCTGRSPGILQRMEVLQAQAATPDRLVLVLGHGSKRGQATDNGIREVARRLGERCPGGPPVRPAFFEFLSPSLAEAVRAAAAEGAGEIAVLPYFLFDGKEIQRDIPQELERLRVEFPRMTIAQLPNLGLDPRLALVVAVRVRAALAGTSQYLPAHGLVRRQATGRLGVVLVNRGSKQIWDAGDRLQTLGELVRQALGDNCLVATAQAENSDRTVEAAADWLAAQGARRIVVAPYLHFVGKVLARNVVPALERARAKHPACQFCLAWTLCVDHAIVDILYDRLREHGYLSAALLASP